MPADERTPVRESPFLAALRQALGGARRMLELIGELERERDALAQAREAASWARTFPGQEAGRMPRWQKLAGGLRRVLEPVGFTAEVDAGRFYAALRGDVAWLKDAVGAEQRQVIEGKPVTDVRREAVWNDTDEGRQATRTERQRMREDHRREWNF